MKASRRQIITHENKNAVLNFIVKKLKNKTEKEEKQLNKRKSLK
jgi:hypothetical protein